MEIKSFIKITLIKNTILTFSLYYIPLFPSIRLGQFFDNTHSLFFLQCDMIFQYSDKIFFFLIEIKESDKDQKKTAIHLKSDQNRTDFPADIYLLRVSDKNIRIRC